MHRAVMDKAIGQNQLLTVSVIHRVKIYPVQLLTIKLTLHGHSVKYSYDVVFKETATYQTKEVK